MDSNFFPGLHVLFLGHGECLLWINFCISRGISNLGFPDHVEIRVLARPGATFQYLSDKAPVIFHFRPHVLVIHLGMFDLLQSDSDPMSLADRLWHSVGLLLSCLSGPGMCKVVFVGQPGCPRHASPDRMHAERLDAFHSRLLRRANGSRSFSFIFMGDLLGNIPQGVGVAGTRLRDLSPFELPFHLFLMVIKRRVAALLNPCCKYTVVFSRCRSRLHAYRNVCAK